MHLTIAPKASLSLLAILCFSLSIGLASTLWGYRFGDGNQVEQLPIVLRAIDPSYLTNDFFTNVTADYGPRTIFAEGVAFCARLAPVSTVYLVLTILGNVAIALVTILFARDLFAGSDLAGLIAGSAVMTLKTFWLGYSNTIYGYFLEPAHLAMPIILVSIWAAFRQKPILSALAAGAASLIHPLMGLETGGLLLSILTINFARKIQIHRPLKFTINKRNWIGLLWGWLVFVGFALLILLPYMNAEQISSSQFIQILAYFRHPHHYIPSTFGIWQYLQAFVFLVPAGIAWYLSARNVPGIVELVFPISLLVFFEILVCLGGYYFVEIYPSRLWTTAQTFRLLFLVKWLGLVGISGWVGFQFQQESRNNYFLYLLLASLVSQLTLFLSFSINLIRDPLRRFLPKILIFLGDGILLALMAVLFRGLLPDFRILILFPLFILMAFLIYYSKRQWLAAGINLVVSFAVVFILLQGKQFLPAKIMALFDPPVITLGQLSGDDIEVANFAQTNTPLDAIILTPPTLGEFRFTADRAIVVDYIAFPFQDLAMVEWQQRIWDCYGIPQGSGFNADSELKNNYRKITRADLLRLQAEYGFNYAVLYTETPTDFLVLYQNSTYKLVEVHQG
jgi:hypothetical protein